MKYIHLFSMLLLSITSFVMAMDEPYIQDLFNAPCSIEDIQATGDQQCPYILVKNGQQYRQCAVTYTLYGATYTFLAVASQSATGFNMYDANGTLTKSTQKISSYSLYANANNVLEIMYDQNNTGNLGQAFVPTIEQMLAFNNINLNEIARQGYFTKPDGNAYTTCALNLKYGVHNFIAKLTITGNTYTLTDRLGVNLNTLFDTTFSNHSSFPSEINVQHVRYQDFEDTRIDPFRGHRIRNLRTTNHNPVNNTQTITTSNKKYAFLLPFGIAAIAWFWWNAYNTNHRKAKTDRP